MYISIRSGILTLFIFTVDETYYDQKEDHIDFPDTEAVIDTGMPKGLVLNLLICPCSILFYYTVDVTNNNEYNDDPPDIETVSSMYLYFMYI